MELLAVRPRSAPELADALGVHVRTARRVLKRLESEGYVVLTDDRRRRYRPTMRVVALAGQVVERAELPAMARQHVTALREEVGGSCHLCVPSHMFALCLVHDQGDCACACRPHLRELVPCHCTAAGKALLAWREGSRGRARTAAGLVHGAHERRPRVPSARARSDRRARLLG
jgi:DNA-binding IclR family transcriptional regulator